MSDDTAITISALVLVLLVWAATNLGTQQNTAYECESFGKTSLNGKVYTCFRSKPDGQPEED